MTLFLTSACSGLGKQVMQRNLQVRVCLVLKQEKYSPCFYLLLPFNFSVWLLGKWKQFRFALFSSLWACLGTEQFLPVFLPNLNDYPKLLPSTGPLPNERGLHHQSYLEHLLHTRDTARYHRLRRWLTEVWFTALKHFHPCRGRQISI